MVTLPKSVRKERMVENANVAKFEISAEDMATLDSLDEKLVTDWYDIALQATWWLNLTVLQGPY